MRLTRVAIGLSIASLLTLLVLVWPRDGAIHKTANGSVATSDANRVRERPSQAITIPQGGRSPALRPQVSVTVSFEGSIPVADAGVWALSGVPPNGGWQIDVEPARAESRLGKTDSAGLLFVDSDHLKGARFVVAVAPNGSSGLVGVVQGVSRYDIQLPRTYDCFCRIRRSDGSPVPDVRVVVYEGAASATARSVGAGSMSGISVLNGFGAVARHGTSGADGLATLRGLPAGRHSPIVELDEGFVVVNTTESTDVEVPGPTLEVIVDEIWAAAIEYRGDDIVGSNVRSSRSAPGLRFPGTPTNGAALEAARKALRTRFPSAIVYCGVPRQGGTTSGAKLDCLAWLRNSGLSKRLVALQPLRQVQLTVIDASSQANRALSSHVRLEVEDRQGHPVLLEHGDVVLRVGSGADLITIPLGLDGEQEVPSGDVEVGPGAVRLRSLFSDQRFVMQPGEHRIVQVRLEELFHKQGVTFSLPDGSVPLRGSFDWSSARSGSGLTMFAPGQNHIVLCVREGDEVHYTAYFQGCERVKGVLKYDPTMACGSLQESIISLAVK